MAVKANATITLSFMVDVKAIYRYYKLQASTASAPAKPTTNPPSGWSDTEPSYTSGSTNTLYVVELTVLTNNTFSYSAVSKSSSYEAAKEAYNKAVAAGNTAENNRNRVNLVESTLEGNKSLIEDLQTEVIGKADGTIVTQIRRDLNQTIEDVGSFQRQIAETYTTKDETLELSSIIQQTRESIVTKVSENDVKSLIDQQKNFWRADFEENGALCGSILLDKSGITVGDGDAGYTTKITPTEFGGYYYGTRVFYLNQDETVSERLRVKKGVDLTNMKITPTVQTNIKGIDFLSSGALLI